MWKYPIKSDKSGYVSPEEFEALEIADRFAICMAATERCAVLRRETPPQPDFTGGGYTVALIPYRLIQSLVERERGLRV